MHVGRHISKHMLILLCITLGGAAAPSLAVADEPRLLEQEPFDQITLNAENDNAVLKVVPLDLPDRRLPEKPAANSLLRIRLLDRPTRQYDVPWFAITEVKLFEQLLLEEAEQLVTQRKFVEAYENYAYLQEKRPEWPGLDAAIDKFLLAGAADSFRRQQYENAYAQLMQLHRRNPRHPQVIQALGSVVDKLMVELIRGEQYLSARGILRSLKETFPDQQLPNLDSWEERFTAQAERLHQQAQSEFDVGVHHQAHRFNRRALQIWPAHAPSRELAQRLAQQRPQVIVGVAQLGHPQLTRRLDDWTSIRRRRLISRTLSEPLGLGAEGASYHSPWGTFEVDPLRRQFAFQLRPGIKLSPHDEELTGYDLSRRLLEIANPIHPDYHADWGELCAGVTVDEVYRVVVDLHRFHPRPQGFLQIPLQSNSRTAESEAPIGSGPYRLASQETHQAHYTMSPGAAQHAGASEVIEMPFADEKNALAALRAGEVMVLDRLPPWQINALRSDPEIIVERYALPTIHVLIPNQRKPLMRNRTFRRALAYGIQREMILREELLAGADLAGAALISGPFPVRTSFDDPIGFASDNQIAPRPYDPRLAFALVQAALGELASESNKASEKNTAAKPVAENTPVNADAEAEETSLPTLMLAHPPDPIVRAACQAIQSHLQRVGLQVTLVEWDASDPAAAEDDYDLRYAALAMWDPLMDARRLLGEGGIAGGHNPYLNQALRRLDQAVDSREIQRRLHEIHRLVHDDATVIPLWQMPEHFAYHRVLSQVGERPLTLYQNIEHWQVGVSLPSEQ